MSEIATFFRKRNEDPGESYQFEVKVEKTLCRCCVYCRQPFQSKLFVDRELPRKDWKQFLDRIEGDIDAQGGGGIIVVSKSDGASQILEVRHAGYRSVQPPRHFVLVPPSRPAYPLPIPGSQKIPPASHAIVPVDAEGEEKLAAFLDMLPWFSPDFEAVVLNTIRRPSLDSRMDDVEKEVFGRTAQQRMKAAARLRWMPDWSKPVTYAVMTSVVLVAMLALNSVWIHRLLPKEKTNEKTSTTATEKSGTQPQPTDTATPAGTTTPKPPSVGAATKELLAAVGNDDKLKSLYQSHFSSYENFSDQQFADLFKKAAAENRPFYWGLIKLQALKMQPGIQDRSFLDSPKEWTKTKDVFDKEVTHDAIDKDAKSRLFLAAVGCLGFGAPALPQTTGSPQWTFTSDGKCTDYTSHDFTDDLEALTKWVKE